MTYDARALPDVTELHPELTAPDERRYAAHMLARERAYDAIFGASHPEGAILSPGDANLTVNWPGGGVYCFAPRAGRPCWTWVTHGLAQPDFDELAALDDGPGDDAVSGFGVEYVLTTKDEAQWAPGVLLDMVRALLFVEGARVVDVGDRVRASSLARATGSASLGAIIGVTSDAYEHDLLLPGGACTLVHIVGVTPAELERARAVGPSGRGTLILQRVLHELGSGDVTDPARACLTMSPRFDDAWRRAAESIRE